MKIFNKCCCCKELHNEVECPNCYTVEHEVIYQCEKCKKTWYFKSSEKECCKKDKEESKK